MSAASSSSAREAKKALGARMREVRKEAGLTARALAARTGQHYTRVSKIENGTQAPTDHDIRTWCAACGAADQAADLIATARSVESAYVEFRRQARAGLRRVLGSHTSERYAATATFRIYEHNAVPNLFQTAGYCAAMLSFWMDFLGTSDRLDAAVSERMSKQDVLHQPGKRFQVVLEEQALRTWFGSAQVHAGQLGRLLDIMALPSVSLGIIPMMTERTGVASAPFWIFDESLVALETPSASIEVTRPDEIAVYTRMFGHLQAAAAAGADARALIVKALDETG